MVVVEFLTKDVEKATRLARQKIISGLTGIGAPCFEDKENLVVELTPNRPDLFSLAGITRALSLYYGKPSRAINKYAAVKSQYETIVDKTVSEIRPYTVNAVVKGLQLNEEKIADLLQLQEKLTVTLGRNIKKFGMGYFDLDRVAFPVRYTAMPPKEIRYKPLNYLKEADGEEIVKNHPKGKEFGHLLKNAAKYPVFIDAKNKIMVLIPIVNSEESGKIDSDTKSLFIEVTGTELEAVKTALRIISCACIDMGGEVCTVKMRYPDKTFASPELKCKEMKLDLEFANKLLGLKLTKKDVAPLLSKMGFELKGNNVVIPPYRADIMHFVDIAEDIAIAYGFNSFEPTLPGFFTQGRMNEDANTADETVRAMGFMEIKTFVLTNRDCLRKLGYSGTVKEAMNPQSDEFTVLRPTLVGNVLDTFFANKTRGLPQKIYEIGHVYDQGRFARKLIFGIMGKSTGFEEIKGCFQTLMKELDMKFELKQETAYWSDSSESGKIIINGKYGHIARASAKVLEAHGIEFPVYICEFEL